MKVEGMQARTEEQKATLTQGGSQLGRSRSVGRSEENPSLFGRSRGYFSCMRMRKRAKTRNGTNKVGMG